MKFGVAMFVTHYSVQPGALARIVEDLGFDSLWLPEHTHIPVSRHTPYPGGGELPREYSSSYDPFVALGAAAAVTTRLRLGTGVSLVPEHDPIVQAKTVATLDVVSDGRFDFGIGGGWNLEEMENHGVRPTTRWRLLRERVLAMKEIWSEDEAEYHGDFVDFAPIWSWPKPVQVPGPPIWIGGQGPRTLDRVVEFGDGWIPNHVSRRDLAGRIRELNDKAAEAGRDPIPVTVFGVKPAPDALELYRKDGAYQCLFWAPPLPEAEVAPLLKNWAAMAGTTG